MAFSFTGSTRNVFGSAGTAPSASVQVKTGPDLEDIQTEGLGFLALGGGQAKVQLLPTSWPADNQPQPIASLMTIASQKGIVAAAGPNAVVIATTDSVRKAFEAPRSGESEIRPFQPQLTLPMPMRISQVAFTADENFLVLSAETGGGLAVYEVQSLLSGSTQSSFEMPTNSLALRALIPNPAPEKGELVATVTTDGELMIANLKDRNFISGANGAVLKNGVSCVAWSTRGKQLVAGLGDGSAYQMTPEGVCKGEIPRPPGVESNSYASSIAWLKDNLFLMVNTPSNFNVAPGSASVFHIITRSSPTEFLFQKISDPAMPFGNLRTPPQNFLLRLKDFSPNLQDLLIVASSASTDIGLFTCSKTPLVPNKPAEKVVGVFTMTEVEDSRRAQLPMTDDGRDTSPVGMALDLSSKEKVSKPIPTDEMDESPTPVPSLMVLNNEGVLASWWVIHSESVKQGSIYPGLAIASGLQQPVRSSSTSTQNTSAFSAAVSKSTFGQPTFGVVANPTTAFSSLKPSGSALGTPASNFGSSIGLNQTSPPWVTTSSSTAANSKPTFGVSGLGPTTAPTTQGVAFGTSAFPGNRKSPWSTMATTPDAPFGQPANLSTVTKSTYGGNLGESRSVFGSDNTGNVPKYGGFASVADKGGFAVAAAAQSSGIDIFGSKPATSGFAAPGNSSGMNSNTSFGSDSFRDSGKPSSLLGGNSFTLGSTFKPDVSALDDAHKSSNIAGTSFFGDGFGSALGEAQKTPVSGMSVDNEPDMDADEPEPSQQLDPNVSEDKKKYVPPDLSATISTTPASTPSSKLRFPNISTPGSTGIFGTLPSSKIQTPTDEASRSAGFAFGTPLAAPSMKTSTFSTSSSPLPVSLLATPKSPKVKQELQLDGNISKNMNTIPEAPLPPDTRSKISFAAGESSVSSVEPDIPLPPDFIPVAEARRGGDLPTLVAHDKKAEDAHSIEGTEGPAEGGESDFGSENEGDLSEGCSEEGSGEDVANDVSPTSELHQTPGFTPQSSFGGSMNRGTSESFFKVPRQPHQSQKPKGLNSRALFGEIDGRTAPIMPPPNPFSSPRSPSPVRSSNADRFLHPDTSRSFSAPGVASQLLSSPKQVADRLPISSNRTFSSALEQRKAESRLQNEIKERKEAEESQALFDREDESIQKFLHQEIIGTKILDDFIAHQDYVGNADKDSIPAQVEAVYRDINSMIDTLGINSCSLKRFIKGHEELHKRSGRTRSDLENDEEWYLAEIKSLSDLIEKSMTERLEHGRVRDIGSKLVACLDLERDLAKLRARHEDIKALLASNFDPNHLNIVRSEPLKAEQVVQQHDLRRGFTKFQKLLSEAEDNLTLLRAKLTAQGNLNGKIPPGPTVEAVIRTIMKMTSMAEKRSGDIDVLENHMRKLRLGSAPSAGSREASPFATPAGKAPSRSQAAPSSLASAYGVFNTPESFSVEQCGLQESLRSSTHSYSRLTPPRRRMNGFTEEDMQRFKTKGLRRKEVTDKLISALAKSGVRVRSVDIE